MCLMMNNKKNKHVRTIFSKQLLYRKPKSVDFLYNGNGKCTHSLLYPEALQIYNDKNA